MGAAGGVMLFLMSGVGILIVGFFVFSYAAHAFLVAFEGTAAGNDEVVWPKEPMYDWLWKLLYLLGLLLLSLVLTFMPMTVFIPLFLHASPLVFVGVLA